MTQQRIGAVVSAADSNAALASVEDLERRGISAAWMTSGSAGGGEALSVFAAAGTRTSDIMMGTAITQTFPRHPVAVAQQTLTLAQFAPGRFRLGLGTSGQSGMEQTIGPTSARPWLTCASTFASARRCFRRVRWTIPVASTKPAAASRPRWTSP